MTHVRDDGLVGTLFAPAGDDRRPAVLAVGGSGGGLSFADAIAPLLASHGYTSMALAYFRMEGLPATLDRIPLEYFERALAWLARHPRVDADRIAMLGGSRGGELVLPPRCTFPSIRAVVAYVPSGLVYGGYPAPLVIPPGRVVGRRCRICALCLRRPSRRPYARPKRRADRPTGCRSISSTSRASVPRQFVSSASMARCC